MFTRTSCLSLSWAISVQSLHPVLFLEHSFQYYPPVYACDFQVVSLSLISPSNPYMNLSSPHTCHILCPFHSSWYDHHTCNNWLGTQFISLLCSLLHSLSKYLPQLIVLRHPQLVFLPHCEESSCMVWVWTHTIQQGGGPFCISVIFKSLC